jgi:hypothetical protein
MIHIVCLGKVLAIAMSQCGTPLTAVTASNSRVAAINSDAAQCCAVVQCGFLSVIAEGRRTCKVSEHVYHCFNASAGVAAIANDASTSALQVFWQLNAGHAHKAV